MTYRHFKHEGWWYALAFAMALAVRLTGLGFMPLTDAEAAPALQALRLSQSQPTAFDPHPLYILSTSVFFLMSGGGSDFLARLFPALMGSLLVLAPLLFDDRLKPRPSLILAFILALDPGLVAISRQAASPILAIVFLVYTAGFFNKGRHQLAAVSAALALLSGPSVWLGLLGIGITFAIAQLFKQKHETSNEGQDSSDQEQGIKEEVQETANLQPFTFNLQLLITFILTFIIAGTLFFTAPAGLGAAFASVPAFIRQWTTASSLSPDLLVISLLIYQPLTLLLAVAALLRGLLGGYRRVLLLTIWLFVSLLLTVFLPARQMADLAWMLLPLGALASLELARHFTIHPEERREVFSVALLTVLLWLFIWLGLAGITWLPAGTPEYNLRAGLLVGSILLLIVSLILIAAGWSLRIARIGAVWGFALGLGALTLGGLFGSAGLRGPNFPEMWWLPNLPAQAGLMRETVSQISELGRGNDFSASVSIMGVDSPALEWALRRNPVQVVSSLDPASTPDFVITSFEMNPQLVSAYRGQDFIWRQTPSWGITDAATWFRWVTLREMPQTQEIIILWARSDLFLDE